MNKKQVSQQANQNETMDAAEFEEGNVIPANAPRPSVHDVLGTAPALPDMSQFNPNKTGTSTTPAPSQPVKRPLSRVTQTGIASSMTLHGNTIYYREMSPALIKWFRNVGHEIAEQAGVSYEDYQNSNTRHYPDDVRLKLMELEERSHDTILCGLDWQDRCLRAWDCTDDDGQPIPLTPQTIRELFYTVKTEISEQIQLSTFQGINQSQYFRLASKP